MLAAQAHAQAQAPAAPAAQEPPAAEDERRVDINEYRVRGNTLLPAIEIQRAVYPFEGPGRRISDVDKARAALQKAYEDKGYQAVSVVLPPQSVQGGVVLLQVVEVKVGDVQVTGAKHASAKEILSGLPALTAGQSPNFSDLNRQLVALNTRSADLQVTPQLRPGALPDTLDVELAVDDRAPLHGGVELNNNYSLDTHELRLQAQLSYDNLWRKGHTLSALYNVSPEDPGQVEVYALTYGAPLPGSDVRLSLTALHSNSDVAILGTTGVLGRGDSVTLTAAKPLGGSGGLASSLQFSIAYKDFTDAISVVDPTGASTSTTPITYYPLSLAYNASYRGQVDQFGLSVALNFAFRGLGSDQDEFDNKRYRALGNFIYLRASANWRRDFGDDTFVYAEVEGQVSNQPLISNEQFSGGGAGSVRGYLQSEILGDQGLRFSTELRLRSIVSPDNRWISDLRPVLFADAAHAWLLDPLPEQESEFDLASVGLGLRSTLLQALHFDFDVGQPLLNTTATRRSHPRLQFRAYSNF